ncbi:MAG TPA: thaumatin family protein [Actinocrinis sp.]|jgi:hypothetical protein|uniref:thaumatin family protein n=1 Tax=Actinocrinis sp. TaxID=1920516 RepID=UPI002DDCA345|nr:thaumatin family protein [Actinocrinis sp.]HEV3172292.1 thaumatin family protein [Actinocrinis sp.]
MAGGIVLVALLAAAFIVVFGLPGGDKGSAPVAGTLSVAPPGTLRAAPASSAASPSATPSATGSPTASASNGAGGASPSATSAPPKAVTAPAGFRAVTFVNAVQQTIWVGAGEQTPQPALGTTGWVLPAGQSLTIVVPDKWNGRFWGRTGCSFNASGTGVCQTGDCAGRFQCTQYGAIPATLAEFNLNSWDNLDFYDVSMVDGSNLPMYINITKGATKDPISSTGCSAAGCTRPVNCPSALQIHAGGSVVGCESACGVLGTDQYCCRGAWAPRSACDPTKWPVDYAAVFKSAEPFAYSYVDDDATSTFTCSGECDYRITFGLSP